MADIKTRDAVKGTIKTIDKAAIASERMKSAYVGIKEKAEQGYYADENSATEYAADRISFAADRAKDEGVHQFNKQGQKAVKTTQENIGKAKDKITDVNGWLSTSQNMAKIFIVLSLVIILLIAPVFSGEYGGVDNIILTSKYGKTKCATAKVLASLLSAVFITTLVVIFNLLIAVAIYGTEGLDCSILFAPIDFLEGYIPFNITCGTVLKYQILLAFMSAISVTGIVLILSAVCKSQMIAFVISAAIHVIPIMLPISETSALYRIIVLMPLFYSQYISIMSVEQMHNGMLYAVWSIPVAIALVVIGSIISHKAFSKHQVR